MDYRVLRIGNAIVARKIAHINGVIAILGNRERPRGGCGFGAVAVRIFVIAARTLCPCAGFGITAAAVLNDCRRLGIAVRTHHQCFCAGAFEHRTNVIRNPFIGVLVLAQILCNAALPVPGTVGQLNAMSSAQADAFARKRSLLECPRRHVISCLSHRKPMFHCTLNRLGRFRPQHILHRPETALIILSQCPR